MSTQAQQVVENGRDIVVIAECHSIMQLIMHCQFITVSCAYPNVKLVSA